MDLKEQILVSLGLNKSVKLAWQEKAEDGTIFVSEADELIAGVDISVLTEDGTTILLPVGTYRTESGIAFRVDEDGVVAEVLETEEVVEEELAEEADVQDWEGMEKRIKNLEDAVADLKSRVGESVDMEDEEEKKDEEKKEEELEDEAVEVAVEETVVEVIEVVEEAVAEIAAAIDDATPAEVTPDLAAKAAEVAIGIMQEKAEEVAEEVTLSSVEKLNKKIKDLETKLSRKPADTPLNVNKFSSNKNYEVSAKDYGKMTRREKFLYDINK